MSKGKLIMERNLKELVSDDMTNTMVASMLLRNIVSFGIISKEELQKIRNKMKQL